ncbi:816_t:CDS:2, partial [Dentiscutata erythropus]
KYYNQLGHIVRYKQKRKEYKKCEHQINDSLRLAYIHFRKCFKITLIQKRKYFKNKYEDSDNDISISTPTSTSSDYISRVEQESLELAFAKSTKPVFKLPNRKKLSKILLDNLFDETKLSAKTLIIK